MFLFVVIFGMFFLKKMFSSVITISFFHMNFYFFHMFSYFPYFPYFFIFQSAVVCILVVCLLEATNEF